MIINGLQIDETEVLDLGRDGSVFTVSDLIDYVLDNPDEFRPGAKLVVEEEERVDINEHRII